MTGAPIYLVSACASGEEFVAAFRRYADKNGLFVPIREPLPSGRRSRFAVTLKDGGVMIEGEAEIVSSARTASVLHGRVGMTLRFLEPDDASKTMLGELEKARLSMRPAPPSVAPRPAEIPPEPRPVPPPVQGRIDAVNALAECVAIGDTSVLGPPVAASPVAATPVAAPPKAGPKFVVPTVPAVASTSGAGGGARAAAPLRPPTSPRPAVSPPPGVSMTPAVSGFSQTMTAVTPIMDPGPTSDTITAATPPEPPGPPTARRPVVASTGAPAVPPPEAFASTLVGAPAAPSPAPPSPIAPPAVVPPPVVSPTAPRRAIEMQAVVPQKITEPHAVSAPAVPVSVVPAAPVPVVPAAPAPVAPAASLVASAAPPSWPAVPVRDRIASDTLTAVPVPGLMPPSAPTDIGGPLIDPLPPLEAVQPTSSRDDESSRTQIHAGAPTREPVTSASPALDPEDFESQRGSTHIGMPPIPRAAAPAGPLPAVLKPAPPIVAPARPQLPEVEIAEPTDLSPGPPEPPAVESPSPMEIAASLPDAPSSRPRKTVIGVVVAPTGVSVLPAGAAAATAADAGKVSDVVDVSLLMADEVTGGDRIVVGDSTGDSTIDSDAPTMSPESPFPSVPEDTQRGSVLPLARAIPPSMPGKASPPPAGPVGAPGAMGPAGPVTPAGAPAASAETAVPAGPATPPAGLPSGDWAIALDPRAPDGWSEPFELVAPEPGAGDPPPTAPPPTAPPLAPVIAHVQPREPAPKRPTPPPGELLVVEPKVQIDPTLIEPLRPMPDPSLRPMPPDVPFRDAVAAAPGAPGMSGMPGAPGGLGYGGAPDAAAAAALPMPMMAPGPPAIPPSGPHGPPGLPAGQVPDYPMDPTYQTVPMVGLPMPELMAPGGGRFGVSGYASDTTLPAQTGRRRVIIVLVSALVAAVIGIVVLFVLRDRHGAGAPGRTGADKPRVSPSKLSNAPARAPSPAHADSQAPEEAPAVVSGGSVAGSAAGGAAPPQAGACFAEVSSVPSGAEIVIDQTNVLGTTPQKVTLPCGKEVELVIRKSRFVPVTRTITPAPDGAKLKVTLAKPTFQVKVSSTPPSATITLNGKSLGVTPTTIKIPAFETSALTITKEGYATETEKVTPKANGVAVHTTLKKLERKKPR